MDPGERKGRTRQAPLPRGLVPGAASAGLVLALVDSPADAAPARDNPAGTTPLPVSRVPCHHHRDEPGRRRAHARQRDRGWLDEHGTQIDYQRRRHLDYRSLLPDADWIQACRSTGTVPGEQSRSLTARRWLFERISGTPADLAPGAYAVTTAGQRSRLDKFAVFVTPGLVASLDSNAGTWLEGNRIDNEEVTWRPPASLLSGLDLPGPDPFAL